MGGIYSGKLVHNVRLSASTGATVARLWTDYELKKIIRAHLTILLGIPVTSAAPARVAFTVTVTSTSTIGLNCKTWKWFFGSVLWH